MRYLPARQPEAREDRGVVESQVVEAGYKELIGVTADGVLVARVKYANELDSPAYKQRKVDDLWNDIEQYEAHRSGAPPLPFTVRLSD